MPSKYVVKISCLSEEESKRLAYQLHDQLADNPDYINEKIIVTRILGTVSLFIDDVDEIPEITLFKKESK